MSEEKKTRTRKPRVQEKSLEPISNFVDLTQIERFDWKKYIPVEYVDIKTAWLSTHGISTEDYLSYSPEQKQEIREKAGEDNMLIKLSGFKFLAHLRGISSVEYRHIGENTFICEVAFEQTSFKISEEKTITLPKGRFCGVASATEANTSYPFSLFLPSMAENRAFIRAIKMAFNINVLGTEELENDKAVVPTVLNDEGCTSPQEHLRSLVSQMGRSFSDLKQTLEKKSWPGHEAWNDYKDIPEEECFKMVNEIYSK